MPISRLLLPLENFLCMPSFAGRSDWYGIPAYFWEKRGFSTTCKNSREIMTSHELLLAIADEDTLELARRMIGKPRLAFLLAKEAIGPEGETSLDAEAVAQTLGAHKRHAYRLIKSHG